MRELVFFEYKKMMKRKSVWISVCAMLFVVLLCSNLSLLGSVYVDDHKVFSHFEEIQIRREGGEKLEGAVLEEGFLEKNVEEYEVYLADRNSGKVTWENYQTVQEEVASAQLLSWWVERLAPGFQEEMQADNFYSRREESMEESWKVAGFSSGEIQAHGEQNERIATPFTYSYCESYEKFALYWVSNMIVLAMAVAVCVAPVFAEEYSTGMDVLQHSSRKGRGKLVAAKLITGFSFTLLLGAVTFVTSLAMEICIYGSGSLDAPIQMIGSLLLSSYPFTVGEMLLLLFFASEISLLVLAAVVMFCSARMNSSFGPVLVGVLLSLLSVVKEMIPSWMITLRKIASMLPGPFASCESLFDERFWKLGGIYLKSYEYVPVIYAIMILLFCGLAYRSFVRGKNVCT